MPRKLKGRLKDAVSFRVTDRQRTFLEDLADENDVGLCEACRMAIDAAMRAREIGAKK